jgi:broad specificity phosphatase PhoE
VDSKFRETGSPVSGYGEEGPYHCEDCIHRTSPDSAFCIHPVVIADPDLADSLVQIGGQNAVQINLEKGCCRFVHPPSIVALVMRHGDTVLNEEGRLRSMMDVDLDEKGQAQAQAAADFLQANFPNIRRIVTTPLRRTQESVAPIAQAFGIQPEIDASIITWNMGVLIGQKKDDVKDVLNHFVENPHEPIPNGESLNDALSRAMPTLERLLEEAEDDPIILICMTSSIIVPLIKLINGTPVSEVGGETGVGPGGILAVSVSGDGYTIKPVFGEEKPAEVGAS